MSEPRSPAGQLARIHRSLAQIPGGEKAVEVVLDIYWIFLRHAPTWPAFRARPDLGKWISRVPADAESLLQRAESLLPYLVSGRITLAKITNTSTPGAVRDGAARVAVYCTPEEKRQVGELLQGALGWTTYWKTNAQTHAELAAQTTHRSRPLATLRRPLDSGDATPQNNQMHLTRSAPAGNRGPRR